MNSKLNIDKNLSNRLYIMKTIAILSVICAHCNLNYQTYFSNVYNNIGTIGVGIFLFISGFCFKEEYDLRSLANKFTRISIPWFISSTMIWLEVGLRKGNLTLISFIFHLIGNGSIFYYLTIYFILEILSVIFFNILKIKSAYVFLISLIANIVANILEQRNISCFFTPYLNPFIFISYFTFGYLLRNNQNIYNNISNSKLLPLSVFAFVLLLIPGFSTYYWNGVIEIAVEFALILFNLYLSQMLERHCIYVTQIGKNTLFIYIWHLIPMTIINYFGNKFIIFQKLFILWPLIIMAIMLAALFVLRKINCSKLNYVIGARL